MMFPKDPDAKISVLFDFTDVVANLGLDDTELGDPQIVIGRDGGDAALVAEGPPVVAGLTVTQLYSGGTRHMTYDMACFATLSTGERRRIADFLMVE